MAQTGYSVSRGVPIITSKKGCYNGCPLPPFFIRKKEKERHCITNVLTFSSGCKSFAYQVAKSKSMADIRHALSELINFIVTDSTMQQLPLAF